jgi:uroporphyrinogen decarboxylase
LATERTSHHQVIENCLNGVEQSITPIALWRHFPVDDQAPGGLAKSVIEYQKTYEFDLVKVTPASSFCIKDWGAVDEWRGNPEGTRLYTQRVIQKPEDWLELRMLDPYQGALGEQFTCLKLICDELGKNVPILQTIFSPLAQAKNLVGGEMLLTHLRQFPQAILTGLQTIAESTRRFIEAANKTGISGVFYAVQHANYQLLSEQEYGEFGRKFDLEILEMSKGNWLNLLHLHGTNIMFKQFIDYPVQIINWHDRETFPSLEEALAMYPGVVCGGLQRTDTMELGTPELVHSEARDAISKTKNKRFILGTGCVMQVTTPRVNIAAALETARRE